MAQPSAPKRIKLVEPPQVLVNRLHKIFVGEDHLAPFICHDCGRASTVWPARSWSSWAYGGSGVASLLFCWM